MPLGQPVVVENRTGAGGNIGAESVAKAAPDGYTLLMGTTSQAISQSLYRRLNYGTAGNGAPPHMTGELFKSTTGVDIQHVPYKGGAPAIVDLVAGQIPVMFDNVPPLLPHVRSGRIRALANTSLTRLAVLPDVPTLDESGLKGFDAVGWNGLLAPAGAPREIVARLHSEVARILRAPDVREQLTGQGADIVGNSPDEFAAWIRGEIKKWAGVVRDSGAKLD